MPGELKNSGLFSHEQIGILDGGGVASLELKAPNEFRCGMPAVR